MSVQAVLDLPRRRKAGLEAKLISICSAHPLVIEAAMIGARDSGEPLLLEATCNQVNQDGGYTGMTPAAFRKFVDEIAGRVGLHPAQLILGGDHLGPNPWKHLPADQAMERAVVMIEAFVRAGFQKLHLDTSMGCLGEAAALPDIVTARRAARLAQAAERAAMDYVEKPVYVIGTEVPIPGGALDALDLLHVTSPEAALATIEIHRQAFASLGLDDAFARVVGVVVQPGVEFSDDAVSVYDRNKTSGLSGVLQTCPQFVFEAHSTDYQPRTALSQLAADGFSILKVGPALTFALREALYGLDQIATILHGRAPDQTLMATMEELMLQQPVHWQKYYHGDDGELALKRHFSFSDRIRYYWPDPAAIRAIDNLMLRLEGRAIPQSLIWQYLGRLAESTRNGAIATNARSLLLAAVDAEIQCYRVASSGGEFAS